MRALLLPIAGLTLLGWGTTSGGQVRGSLGDPIQGLTAEEQTAFNSGRPFFNRTWIAEGEIFFNSNSCLSCHRQPTSGGVTESPFNHVFFVPDAKDPSGFATFPWRVGKNGQVTGQRLPYGDYHTRRPQPMYGLGLLEAITDQSILALADPEDKNKDGISGRALMVDGKVGRFGWKANAPTIQTFTDNAFRLEIGLTKDKGRGGNLLTDQKIKAVADMIRFLAPPQPTKENAGGKATFMAIGCGSCHTPKLTTGANAWPSLSKREIEPYTDMLLHDLGPGPATTVKTGNAAKAEFRTAPLWGLGQVGGGFFHDGSTTTFEEAILRHEGEAMGVLKKYQALTRDKKDELILFLKGL
jgi:CxxC motif-containing protein (DUF1111 family)